MLLVFVCCKRNFKDTHLFTWSAFFFSFHNTQKIANQKKKLETDGTQKALNEINNSRI